MTRNMGSIDQAVRLILAVLSLIGVLWVGIVTPAGIVLLVVAAILVVTAAAGFCPLYAVFGFSTRGGTHTAR